MADLIDRDALLQRLNAFLEEPEYQHEGEDWRVGACHVEEFINDAPSVDALHEQTNSENTNNWISVEDRLPENETPVLVCATRKFENKEIRLVSKAFYTDGKHNTETSFLCWDSGDMDLEYDETDDAYIIPDGWWEDANYLELFAPVDDVVTHWMPLPEPPKGVAK